MITRRGERDREGGTGRRKEGEGVAARESKRREGMLANTLKEIAGVSFVVWN